jgi:hypothetical protein
VADRQKLRRRPGYFASRRAIDRLHRLQDLIRYHQRWAHQLDLARLLSELLPGGAPENDVHQYQRLEREINRLLPLVAADLRWAGIPTVVQPRAPFADEKGADQHRDLLLHSFDLCRGEERSAATFDLTIHTLDRGIGVYKACQAVALRGFVNPLSWLGWVVGLPASVLERAGLANESTTSVVVQTYAWIVRVLMVILIGLALTKLGTMIPWEKLLTLAESRWGG